MNLLLHMCCGPCTTSSYKRFVQLGYNIKGFFFNPNIHPYREYKKRLETLEEYCSKEDISLLIDNRYLLEEFLKEVVSQGENRCFFCYSMRLEEAANRARQENIPYFSSTLLISPYQKHEIIIQAGEDAAQKSGVNFVYEDLRPFYKDSVQISRQEGMYRQPYCGCIYSEKDRYYKLP